MKINPEMCCAH